MNIPAKWNWQQDDWPNFTFTESKFSSYEQNFLLQAGHQEGAFSHLQLEEQLKHSIDWMKREAYKTSEIEGEILDHESLQASLLKNLGISSDHRKIPASEQGISEMMIDLYHNFDEPLSAKILFRWHQMVMRGRSDLRDLGRYRTDPEPMQIISGSIDRPQVHFEAPPHSSLPREMKKMIDWFNQSSPSGKFPLSPLLRAGITHHYFISIHPFEDGNGRIARALVEKSISQYLGHPSYLSLSYQIQKKRKSYYHHLELSNKENQIDLWLNFFAQTIVDAQKESKNLLLFLISKTKFYRRHQNQLNARQSKVIERIFQEGPSGFKGGLSADKYLRITKTSRATATRDLQDLVQKSILRQSGELKGTRYELIFEK